MLWSSFVYIIVKQPVTKTAFRCRRILVPNAFRSSPADLLQVNRITLDGSRMLFKDSFFLGPIRETHRPLWKIHDL